MPVLSDDLFAEPQPSRLKRRSSRHVSDNDFMGNDATGQTNALRQPVDSQWHSEASQWNSKASQWNSDVNWDVNLSSQPPKFEGLAKWGIRVLDSIHVKHAFKRMAGVLLRVANMGLVAGLMLNFGLMGWGAWSMIRTNSQGLGSLDAMQIKEIRVEVMGRTSIDSRIRHLIKTLDAPDALWMLTGEKPQGQQSVLWTIDHQALRAKVIEIAGVEQAWVYAQWPNTLKIDIIDQPTQALWWDGLMWRGLVKPKHQATRQSHEAAHHLPSDYEAVVVGDDVQAVKPVWGFRLVGQGVPHAFGEVDGWAKRWPRFFNEVTQLQRIDERRWNIHMQDGLVIMLPAHLADATLGRWIEEAHDEFLRYEWPEQSIDPGTKTAVALVPFEKRRVRRVDLRIPGRMIFRLVDNQGS